jgi:GNAT superfamily N-acetyltransferase
MRIQQIDSSELESPVSGSRRPWLAAAYGRLLELPGHPQSRVLIAVEGRQPRAILGLELVWAVDGRLVRAIIRLLEVDPEHERRGIGSRLVRFAEGIAHINGCERVHVAPGLERWGGGGCWLSLGYDDLGPGLSKDITPRFQQGCA